MKFNTKDFIRLEPFIGDDQCVSVRCADTKREIYALVSVEALSHIYDVSQVRVSGVDAKESGEPYAFIAIQEPARAFGQHG